MFTDLLPLTGHKISTYLNFVKFSHSIFALPFALSMFVFVAGRSTTSLYQLVLIVLALVAARTAAMSFNRIVDLRYDKKNARTSMRELPSGKISRFEAFSILILSTLFFFFLAAPLGPHCLILAPFVLGILFLYSYSKRFTRWSHVILGLALALAPGGVWYALTAEWAWTPVPMMFAVLFWVAGFDILYACQDSEFDRSNQCFSLPAAVGHDSAFWISKLFHLVAVVFLIVNGMIFGLGVLYYVGVVIFAGILFSQYRLISPDDLEKIDLAFFNRNGLASILFFCFVLADWLLF